MLMLRCCNYSLKIHAWEQGVFHELDLNVFKVIDAVEYLQIDEWNLKTLFILGPRFSMETLKKSKLGPNSSLKSTHKILASLDLETNFAGKKWKSFHTIRNLYIDSLVSI